MSTEGVRSGRSGGPPDRFPGLVVGLLAASLAVPTAAADPEILIERTGPERGLSVDNVTAIHQDRTGFLWIGTRQGLLMYDGYTTASFEHDVSDPTSLSDNLVRTIYEDRAGDLWIGTNAGGLDRLDRATWEFEHHRHDSGNPRSISHDSVNVILEDRAGDLWIGTQIGLNRFVRSTGTFERFLSDPGNPAAISHDYVYALHEDRDGVLWIGTVGGGLNRFDPAGGFVAWRPDPGNPRGEELAKVFAIVEDRQDRLWLGTESGIIRFDRDLERFVDLDRGPDDGSLIAGSIVTSLALDDSGTLWVGTWGSELNRVDTRTGRVLAPLPLENPSGVGEVRIVDLVQDRSGSLWIGTWEAGLMRSRRLPRIARILGPESGLSGDATAVLGDPDRRLWVGTWGEGLHHGDPVTQRFDPERPDVPPELTAGTVLSLHRDRDGTIWIGRMDGLYRFAPGRGAVTAFRHDPASPDSLGPGYVTAVVQDRDGRIWVGVGGSGLHRLNLAGDGFERFVHDPDDPTSPSEDYVTTVHEGRDGTLWIGTRSGGLNGMDLRDARFERYLPDPSDDRSLSHHNVSAIVEHPEGTLWVATAGGGLNRGERGPDGRLRFDRLTERDGLIDDNIRSVAVDDDGSLWLATARGMCRFDPVSGTFASYDTSDGMPVSGFNNGAASSDRDALYFGTGRGVVMIRRGTPYVRPDPAPTVFRSIRTLRGPVAASRPPWALESLQIPYGEVLSFEFAVLDYGDPLRHRFAYRLAGVRDEWVDLGTRREITFTDLDPGDYTLSVRGRNAHGVWSAAPVDVRLDVVPPFWMTTWFRLTMVGAVVLVALGAHRVRTSALERRNRRLMALKEEREAALAEARASQSELHGAYDRLRSLTRRLELAKEEERKRIARELHDEMGQALTAAKINLQLLEAAPDQDGARERVADSVSLVDRMIRHVRQLSLDLRPPLLDELGLAVALRGYLEAQAQRTTLEVRVDIDPVPRDLPPEVEITAFRVVQEAVTNVLRHAGASRIEVTVRHDPPWLELSVRDDGGGFEVESTLEQAPHGGHLGLMGIWERVEGLGGSVDVRSAPDCGAEVRVRVPIQP